jgi:hypothetical protein
MLIKSGTTNRTTLSQFDLLGQDEVALSKAFAFLLGSDKDCYFEFLKFLGLKQKRSSVNFFESVIGTERIRDEGRIDIELRHKNHYQVIIECKVRKNKLLRQRTQYLTVFDKACNKKILCFITQERDTNKQIAEGVSIINSSWLEIIELFNKQQFVQKDIVKDFLNFATRNYKMKTLKEVLIQDVTSAEITRYERFSVYRRNPTFGSPIYFAPYYTRGSGKVEGISNLSKVLGILTLMARDIDNFLPDLQNFKTNDDQIIKWLSGVKQDQDDKVYTYFFLSSPFKFKTPLRKDGGIKKGRGKNWIAAKIPPNRCISFIDLVSHIPELK